MIENEHYARTDAEREATVEDNSVRQTIAKPNVMRCLLNKVADGETEFTINYPNFGLVKVKIVAFDFTNIEWKPVKVKILDSLLKEETVWEDADTFPNDMEQHQVSRKVNVTWQEEWCKLEWFENIA